LKVCPNAVVEKDLFKKKKWKDINIASDIIDKEDSKKGGDLAQNKLNKMKASRGEEDFEMKKVSTMSLRRYFKDFMDLKHPTIPVEQLVANRTVLIIDDTLEEGVTLKDSISQLLRHNPKEVYAYIFLMGKGSG
jgi:phosphoribosylpyrophosphate synthetase